MKKQVFCTLLAAMMSAAALVSCGGNNTSDASSAGQQESSQAEANQDGGEITIYQNCGKLQSSGKPGSSEDSFKAVQDYILQETGIHVNVIVPPTGEEENKLNMMLAAQEEFDLFWGGWTRYADEKVIAPLTDSVTKYGQAIVESWGQDAMDQTTDSSGVLWGIPRMAPLATYPVYVREDWLQQVGLSAPTTIDELEEVLKAFKEQDPAGNGQTIPLISTKGEDLHKCLSAGFTGKGYGYYQDTDGKIKPTVMDIKFKDYLTKMNEWYEKGYLYGETFAIDGNTSREIIKKGQVGAAAMWYSAITIQSPYIQPAVNYLLCAPMTGPAGTNCETGGTASENAALVPAYSENVDTVVKYINWAHEDIENHIVLENGIKDVDWKYTDEENHVIELLAENYIGEFVAHQGVGLEQRYSFSDPIKKMHYDYLRGPLLDLDRTVLPDTYDVIMNNAELQEAVPNLEDIKRMIEEETVKFITGIRPLSEYEAFQNELMEIGMEDYIDELTRQYTAAKE